MGLFIFSSSLLYLLGMVWYMLVDRRNQKKVIFIPTEFIYVIGVLILLMFYWVYARRDVIYSSTYFLTFEGKLEFIGVFVGVLMVIVHAISKDLEIRHDLRKWPFSIRKIISFIHHKFSHKLIYLSIVIVLLSFAFGEIDHNIYLLSVPNKYVIAISGIMFSIAFYRNLVHGNTWIMELITIPLSLFLLAIKIVTNDVIFGQTTFVYFAFIVFTLTPLLLITDKYIINKKLK